MSYRICYGKEENSSKRKHAYAAVIGIILVFTGWFLALNFFMPKQAQRFRNMFFPWSQATVQEALTDLKEDIQEGISFREAAQTFYSELLYDAAERN